MPDKFYPLNEDEKAAFAKIAESILPSGYESLKFCTVLSGKLLFYPKWDFVQIQKEAEIVSSAISIFMKEGEFVMLDWQPATLLSFNQNAPLSLSVDMILKYVKFFFDHTIVKDGKMEIIEAYEDFKWREEPAPPVKKVLSSLLRPPHLMSWDEQNNVYEVGAHILFQRNLFECRIHVNAQGEITILERTLQVEDMPVLEADL